VITLNTGSSGVPMVPMSKCFAPVGRNGAREGLRRFRTEDLRRHLGKQNHPERIYQEFIEAHRNDVMLNAGLLGGTRADVMAFHGIIRLYYRIESYRFWKKEQAGAAVGDMMALALSLSHLAIAWSPARASIRCLKLMVSVEYAWWKHK
jgi:hypothetical protein